VVYVFHDNKGDARDERHTKRTSHGKFSKLLFFCEKNSVSLAAVSSCFSCALFIHSHLCPPCCLLSRSSSQPYFAEPCSDFLTSGCQGLVTWKKFAVRASAVGRGRFLVHKPGLVFTSFVVLLPASYDGSSFA